MSKPRITIVGLGLIGGSIGLALRQAGNDYEVVGHDRELAVAGKARKRGAVSKTEWNLISACEGADLIIIATPVVAIKETLVALAPYLKPGCLITDTASIKGPVMAWAKEILPDTVNFVGGDPVISQKASAAGSLLTGIEGARADLFQGGLYCLIPSSETAPQAVQLATDLVHLLGARPFFLDAAEHDGLVAGVDHLPFVLSAALLGTTITSPAWREMRKLAGDAFQSVTCFSSADAATYRDACLTNGENIVRWIDACLARLKELREVIVAQEAEKLEKTFEEAMSVRDRWLRDKAEGRWELAEETSSLSARQSFLRRLIGIG
ncbi:MAG TPA: prephenate dehydrogenase/arogenate dehydrogenase family protein [Anaerolineae bacterium]|nr:prephenate dehydrogenase/arogenate dehydrogenase family protein [Anaerolineae bacterium]